MVNRLARIGLAAFLTTALAGQSQAWAQEEEEEEELGDDDDPCKGVEPACGEEADDDDGGGELAAKGKGDGDGEGSGGGDGEGEGDGGGSGGDDEGESSSDDDEGESSDVASSSGADADATVAASMGSNLGEGKIAINAGVKVGLSDGSTGDPISIEPDIWYGINAKLTAGVVTSSQAATGFWGGAGSGLCAVGDLCDPVFDNVGAEALYALTADPSFLFALDIGFHAVSIDGTVLSAKVGGKGLWRSGQIGIGFAPNVFVGVTERGAGNKETLNLPVDLSYMMSETLSVGVQTGIITPFEAIGDSYKVPVALGGYLVLSPKLSASAAFSLDAVTSGAPEGAEAPGPIDTRTFALALGYTM